MSRLLEEPLGAYNFNVLRAILETYKFLQIGLGVEVGVFDGGTSSYLLNSFPNLRLVSVDPYKAYYEYGQARLNEAEVTACNRLSSFGERSVRVKQDSTTAATIFPDGSFDFAFIDADHSYDTVKQDIASWYPKVRVGGLFAGHDYRWEGVTRAVEEFATEHDLTGFVSPKESDIWWFQKK